MFIKPLKDVFIAIPVPQNGKLTVSLVMKLIKWSALGASVNMVQGPLIDDNRNICVREFLKTRRKYLLFIDSDTVPNLGDIKALMRHKKDIIGGVYNLVTNDKSGGIIIGTSAFLLHAIGKTLDGSPRVQRNTGLQKVSIIATGFLLIHRRALEKIPEPWFETKWLDEKHVVYFGEDVTFCKKAEEKGIDIWCDTDLFASHLKEIFI
jgi:hypothetical protein